MRTSLRFCPHMVWIVWLLLLQGPLHSGAQIIADSVADFSGTQGQAGWTYGYRDYTNAGGNFVPFPANYWNGAYWDWPNGDPPWTMVGSNDAHPNLNPTHAAARRWTTDYVGPVRIAGVLRKSNTACGDGVTGWLVRGGTWLMSQTLGYNDSVGVAFEYYIDLQAEQWLELAIHAGTDSNVIPAPTASCDSSELRMTVEAAARPVAAFPRDLSGTQGMHGWYYGYYNRSSDPDQTYQQADFLPFPDSHWNGASWRWLNGNPPWTSIHTTSLHPNKAPQEHWVVLRYSPSVSGRYSTQFAVGKQNVVCGDGVEVRLVREGGVVWLQNFAAGNATGASLASSWRLRCGAPVDLIVAPKSNDLCDGTRATAAFFVDGDAVLSATADGEAAAVPGPYDVQLAEFAAGPPAYTPGAFTAVAAHADLHVSAAFDCGDPNLAVPPMNQPYVDSLDPATSATYWLAGVDEVTLDNCSSAWYRWTFDLPVNFWNASLTGLVNADDLGVVYLNGHRLSAELLMSDVDAALAGAPVDRTDSEGRRLLNRPTTDPFATPCGRDDLFAPGTNELVVGVMLAGSSPTGLEFKAALYFDRRADVNCDGHVDFFDIDPFVLALSGPADYYAAYPGCVHMNADANGDGVVNFFDIDAFVAWLGVAP